MPNRLARETSPYLLQHQDNPVDWYPWGEEALARARDENKPILLSIGYSACHWCHVMEHESFESPEIARRMNEHFVNVKVDREERPDLDGIYMSVVQALTHHGGWPMTVFLTPEGIPFYAGTYFPPEDRMGMPGFPRVLESVAAAWRERPEDVERTVGQIREFLRPAAARPAGELQPSTLDQAARTLLAQIDWRNGGVGGKPKFPQPMSLELLLRAHRRQGLLRAREAVELTLTKMARGGIYDQLGGGFARYSVDEVWLVPHFEKMLYDNALLARCYLQAHQATGNPFYRTICEETLDYIRREMTSPEGGFYSTQDADSEGVEGKFYVWSPSEIEEILGSADARVVNAYYGVTIGGNFEHKNILHVPRDSDVVASILGMKSPEVEDVVARARPRLLAARARRVPPGRDEKVLTAWNGLMLQAFAEAAAALGRNDYRETAVRNAEFVWARLRRDGRLLRTYKDGQAKLNGYLEDYAFYADGLLSLYEASFDPRWYEAGARLVESMLTHFWDDEVGGFYDTSDDHEKLITRPRDVLDNATPSGNSAAALVLLRLGALAGDHEYVRRSATILGGLVEQMSRYPTAFGRLLCAADAYLDGIREVAIVGDPSAPDTAALLEAVRRPFLPNRVIALARPDDRRAAELVPLLADRPQLDGRAIAYVCRNFACQRPTADPAELTTQLGA